MWVLTKLRSLQFCWSLANSCRESSQKSSMLKSKTDNSSNVQEDSRTDAPIEKLPVETLLQIFSYIGYSNLRPLKLAGSRRIASIIRQYRCPSFEKYLEDFLIHEPLRSTHRVLVLAALRGRVPLVLFLLDHPSKHTFDCGENAKECAFMKAAEAGHAEIVQIFLERTDILLYPSNRHSNEFRIDTTATCYPLCHFDGPLHRAVKGRQIHIAELLLQRMSQRKSWVDMFSKHGDVNRRRYAGRQWMNTMNIASEIGDEEMVRLLVRYGADVNYTYKCDQQVMCKFEPSDLGTYEAYSTPLHCAAKHGHGSLVTYLLQTGATPNPIDRSGETPLDKAAAGGWNDIVGTLLQHGAPVNGEHSVDSRALILAVTNGHEETVELLLSHNANANSRTGSGHTLLFLAAKCRKSNMFRLLLLHGASLEQRDIEIAVWNRDIAALKMLLDLGVEKSSGVQMDGAILMSISAGRIDMFQALLEHSYMSQEDYKRMFQKGIWWAALKEQWDMVKAILSLEENETLKAIFASIALVAAAGTGHDSMVEMLLQEGADINYVCDREFRGGAQAPLHNAAWSGHLQMVKTLLDRGANIEAKTPAHLTAMHRAALGGYDDICSELLQRGAQVNVVSQGGTTPLLLAVRHNKMEVVKVLLKAGAKADAKHGHSEKPLHIAARNNTVRTGGRREEIYKELVKYGADPRERDADGNPYSYCDTDSEGQAASITK